MQVKAAEPSLRQPTSHVMLFSACLADCRAHAWPVGRIVQCRVTARNHAKSSECLAAT